MRNSLKLILVLLLALAGGRAYAAGKSWQAVPGESKLSFTARYENQPLDGSFSRFEVELIHDPDTGIPSSIAVRVDVTSVDMNDREINEELAQTVWFDSGNFPEAVFRSDDIIPIEGGGLLGRGTLALKGRESPLELPFRWSQQDQTATLTGELELSRLAWQVGMGEWADTATIGDSVEVRFRVALIPKD